jgi:hypothetical protein
MLFDTESMPYILDMVPAAQIQLMKEEQFIPCACTPLLDAIGMALTRLEAEVKKHERALASVTIITDGYENASTEYNLQQIHQLIGRLKEQEGWNFAFMGANQDVTKVCIDLNIDVQNAQAWEFSAEGTRHAFDAYKEGNMSFFCAVENCDREVGENVSEALHRKLRRKMMASRSFFKRDEDK